MKRIMLVLFVMLSMVVMLVPIAQASPPLNQDLSGKYVCYGPWVIISDVEEAQAVYRDLSKKEAEAGLATGAYVECSNKSLPYQAGS